MSLAFSASADEPVTALSRALACKRSGFFGVRCDTEYAMITSQTCDLRGERGKKYPLILVAPVYNIVGAIDRGQLGHVRSDRIGEFIRLDGDRWNNADEVWVADLRFEAAVEKGVLTKRQPLKAFASEDGYLRCSRKIARVRSRAAIDDIVDRAILRPLAEFLRSGIVDNTSVDEVLIKATPNTVDAKAVRIYVLLNGGADTITVQEAFDDWHADLGPLIPAGLTFLGVDVRHASQFTWIDYRGVEIVDFSYLSDSQV